MKQINVTVKTTLWVPDDSYGYPGALSLLMQHIHGKTDAVFADWAAQPEVAKGTTVVSVEVPE